jgi:hypothetical protein
MWPEPGEGRSAAILAESYHAIGRALDEHGAILFQGYGVSPEAIRDFGMSLMERPFVHGGARPSMTPDGSVQTAEVGNAWLRVHCEMAYTPIRPDLCVFACVTPAETGGETLLCDGAQVYQQLAEPMLTRFRNERLSHVRVYRPRTWSRTFGIESTEALRSILDGFKDLSYIVESDGRIFSTYTFSAITQLSAPLGWRAFANSLSSLADQMDGVYPYVTWESGAPIDLDVREKITELLDRNTVPYGWEPNDILLLDNWRWMHGRRSFEGSTRKLMSMFGYGNKGFTPRTPLL